MLYFRSYFHFLCLSALKPRNSKAIIYFFLLISFGFVTRISPAISLQRPCSSRRNLRSALPYCKNTFPVFQGLRWQRELRTLARGGALPSRGPSGGLERSQLPLRRTMRPLRGLLSGLCALRGRRTASRSGVFHVRRAASVRWHLHVDILPT
jgi:hypothetical protein